MSETAKIDLITSCGYGSLAVATILYEPAHRTPDAPAIIMGDTVTTYGELWAQAMADASALRALAIERGHRGRGSCTTSPTSPHVRRDPLAERNRSAHPPAAQG